MTNIVKTTLNIPEDILQKAKLLSVEEKKTLSKIITESLEQRIGIKKRKIPKSPLSTLGKLRIGVDKIYKKRSDIYG
ncbi:hypothetical protein A2714_02270 [Candidatus Woesebacteria bacterium RIFCSPHIGHO2_01_FULL_38_9]|uniref:Uncharacterized protein n=2 Tax=Candidatus Woeseibacteriota TaxID=1752722 RepID=A0A1F7Y115_9BACT|nr:MAG: hypothetical protein A2714_02270 [Candidatus Woesebacteria bacterium RIFCSPHIGHO2_01_FULL_38_9]OGM60993.1 MAG: hypothetical protein A3A75_01920 [Candidatus Woesebacteria bacterium RIFCSPLOWO2_01_FULL_39_10]